jgi:hypothetical protein
LIGGIDISSPSSGARHKPLLGAGLQIVELLAETREVYKRMRISRLARLQPIFRFGEARREAMCRKVQLHGACAILREGADAVLHQR